MEIDGTSQASGSLGLESATPYRQSPEQQRNDGRAGQVISTTALRQGAPVTSRGGTVTTNAQTVLGGDLDPQPALQGSGSHAANPTTDAVTPERANVSLHIHWNTKKGAST